jgi:predicted nucleic acid-binding Zn ribbon protein
MDSASTADTRAPRHCYKCGREIGPDESICGVCNRAGMATPSASQYHGTLAVAIIAGVVALAVWASLSMRGVGPYQAEVVSVAEAPPNGATVTISVMNQGTARGSASCRFEARDAQDRPLRSASMLTGPLEPGQRATFTTRIVGLSRLPASVVASCR